MAAPALTRAPRDPTRLVAPSDFYVLLVMALMAGVARVGSPRLRDHVAAAVSEVAFRLSRAKRRSTEATLARVFGTRLSARRRYMLTRRAFHELWLDVFTLLPLRGTRDDPMILVGAEHLQRALADGRGAIVWISNHWAGMATLKRTLHTHGFGVHKVHAEHHVGGFPGYGDTWVQQRIITPFFDRHERRIVAGLVSIKRGSLAVGRDLAGRLRANGIACIAADGRMASRFVAHPFLGIPEAFPTGVVSLARTSGAPLLPTFCLRRAGRGMRVVVEPPIAMPPAADREDGVRTVIARFVERLEHHARRHPSRYVNWGLIGAGLPPIVPR